MQCASPMSRTPFPAIRLHAFIFAFRLFHYEAGRIRDQFFRFTSRLAKHQSVLGKETFAQARERVSAYCAMSESRIYSYSAMRYPAFPLPLARSSRECWSSLQWSPRNCAKNRSRTRTRKREPRTNAEHVVRGADRVATPERMRRPRASLSSFASGFATGGLGPLTPKPRRQGHRSQQRGSRQPRSRRARRPRDGLHRVGANISLTSWSPARPREDPTPICAR